MTASVRSGLNRLKRPASICSHQHGSYTWTCDLLSLYTQKPAPYNSDKCWPPDEYNPGRPSVSRPGLSCKESLPEGRVLPPPTPPDPILFPAQGILNFLPRLSMLSPANKREDWQPLQKHDKHRQEEWDACPPGALSSHAPLLGFLTNPQTSRSRVGLP